MAGRLVFVVGPSGAGKDTLIATARAALDGDPHFAFPRRVVTRPAIPELEDHDSVSVEEFARREADGAFALSWRANGLCYGLPASLGDDLAAGRIVVANASRAAIAAARQKYSEMAVILVEATQEVRAGRLAGRGREDTAEIAARLAREVEGVLPEAIKIDNSGPLEQGVARFLAALRALAGG